MIFFAKIQPLLAHVVTTEVTLIIYVLPLTCVPNILDPDVGAGSKEQPMNRDEQKANHVGRDGNANEKYWECLKNKQKEHDLWFKYTTN